MARRESSQVGGPWGMWCKLELVCLLLASHAIGWMTDRCFLSAVHGMHKGVRRGAVPKLPWSDKIAANRSHQTGRNLRFIQSFPMHLSGFAEDKTVPLPLQYSYCNLNCCTLGIGV